MKFAVCCNYLSKNTSQKNGRDRANNRTQLRTFT